MQLHPPGRGPARRHRADHDPHARVGDPHHRQEGPARQSGRPRPLHPVHGRGAADLRPPHRRRLRGQRRRRSAHRRAARQDGLRRGPAVHARLPRSRRSARSRTASRSSSRTARARRKSSSNIRSAIAAAAPKACRCWSRSSGPTSRAASRRSSRRRSSTSRSTRSARRDAGARVRRPDGDLMSTVADAQRRCPTSSSHRDASLLAAQRPALAQRAGLPEAQVRPVGDLDVARPAAAAGAEPSEHDCASTTPTAARPVRRTSSSRHDGAASVQQAGCPPRRRPLRRGERSAGSANPRRRRAPSCRATSTPRTRPTSRRSTRRR